MSTHLTNDQTFDKDISNNDVPVVVDFGAEWCGPCKVLDPILEEIAVENKDKVKIYKINIAITIVSKGNTIQPIEIFPATDHLTSFPPFKRPIPITPPTMA